MEYDSGRSCGLCSDQRMWRSIKTKKYRYPSPPIDMVMLTSGQEYSARLLIPLSTIISAVEIDPISKSKPYCMQIITEEKSYRFCAPSEEVLAKWLGALKSLLARRKDKNHKRIANRPAP